MLAQEDVVRLRADKAGGGRGEKKSGPNPFEAITSMFSSKSEKKPLSVHSLSIAAAWSQPLAGTGGGVVRMADSGCRSSRVREKERRESRIVCDDARGSDSYSYGDVGYGGLLDALLGNASARYGMVVHEQRWLYNAFNGLTATRQRRPSRWQTISL